MFKVVSIGDVVLDTMAGFNMVFAVTGGGVARCDSLIGKPIGADVKLFNEETFDTLEVTDSVSVTGWSITLGLGRTKPPLASPLRRRDLWQII